MRRNERFAVVNDAWHPALAAWGETAVVAWRGFDVDRSILEPDEIRVAPLSAEGPGEPRTVVNGLFVGGPRPVRLTGEWAVSVVRREEEVWRLECHHLDDELSPASVEPISEDGLSVTAFSVAGERENAVVAWVEVDPPGRRLMVRRMEGDEPQCLAEGAIWAPVIVTTPDAGIMLAWEDGGRIQLARLDTDLSVTDEATAALPERVLIRPALDAFGETAYLACQSHGTWGTGTERLNGDTRLHAFRWEGGTLEVSGGQPDGRIPIETRSRFDLYRDEPPRNRRLPLAPQIVAEGQQQVRVFFRHFRDAQMNDWGWTLRCAASSPAGFAPAETVSREAGYPDGQFDLIRHGSEYILAVAESTYPVGSAGFASRRRTGPARVSFYRLEMDPADGESPWADPPALPRPSHRAGPKDRRPQWDGLTLIYADLHRHSSLSRCVPEGDAHVGEHLRYAIDRENLGAYCMTDHWPNHAGNPEQKADLGLIDACREPGRFVPLFGAEGGKWPGAGDVNVYCRDLETVPEIERIQREYRGDLPGAVDYVRDSGLLGEVILERHFHGMVGGGWPGQLTENALAGDDEVEPLVEVIQTRGHAIDWFCRILQDGQRKGVTGGSDHCRPTDRKSPSCLTGLWVDRVNAEGVWEALMKRRTFATNGHRIEMRLHTGEARLGGMVETNGPTPVRWEVSAPDPLETVEIYRDGFVLERVVIGDRCSAAGTLCHSAGAGSETNYFLVARTEAGGLGISSPVWIGGKPNEE